MEVFCTHEMTHSPDRGGKAFVCVRPYTHSGPWLLSEEMWDLNKHMKWACEAGGGMCVLLKEYKLANFSQQKNLQKTNNIQRIKGVHSQHCKVVISMYHK